MLRPDEVRNLRHTAEGDRRKCGARYPVLAWIHLLDPGFRRGDDFMRSRAGSIVSVLNRYRIRETPAGGESWIAARKTSMAWGRGKVARQAMTMRLKGAGSVKGRNCNSGSFCGHDSAAETGTTEIPAPLATMCLTVSRELPSSDPSTPPGSERWGHACTT